jgi:hypothetical protein
VAIEQLAQPCWYARYDGGEEYANNIHYDSETAALEAAAEVRADYQPGETPAVETGKMPARCWAAQCEECSEYLRDGEYDWGLHLHTRAEAERMCGEYGWIVTRDGAVLCDGCAPDCDRADLAVTEQVPGQATLLGEDSSDDS